jgi:hypothetical protein
MHLRSNQRKEENDALAQARRDDEEEITSPIYVFTVVELGRVTARRTFAAEDC